MPRYFFRIEPDGPFDAEGEELTDDAAATNLAGLVIKDMVRNHPGWGDRRLTVFDDAGRLVVERALAGEVVPLVLPLRVNERR